MANSQLVTRIVSRNDIKKNWEERNPVLLKGEIGIEIDNNLFKIGDGVATWNELKYAGVDLEQIKSLINEAEDSCYVATRESGDADDLAAIARVVPTPAKGDMCIVRELISGDKYTHTGYFYSGTEWQAMDGNYNAKNVYFSEDFKFTKAVGTVVIPESGNTEVAAAGKSLQEFFSGLFAEESGPSAVTDGIVQPKVTISAAAVKSYEVGTTVTPSYSASLSAGSYAYGPETGIVATGWKVTDTLGHESSAASGTFADVIVTDGMTAYKITAEATYDAGAIPLSNLGNPWEADQIAAGSKSASTSSSITGYRNTFYGTTTDKAALTSDIIRGLKGSSGRSLVNGSTFDVSLPVGAMRVVVAYPASLRDMTEFVDTGAGNFNIINSLDKSTVQVEGAEGRSAIDYKVYVLEFATASEATNTYKVKI